MNEIAEIFGVYGLPPGEDDGDPREIEYDVIIRSDTGDYTFRRVVPANRRIDGSVMNIYPARLGDPVIVCRKGDTEVQFIINELPAIGEDCTP